MDMCRPDWKFDEKKNDDLKTDMKDQMKVKSSIEMRLGTFQAAKILLYIHVANFLILYMTTHSSTRDPRTVGYPLVGNLYTTSVVTAIFMICALTFGPKWMEHREPIKPKKLMMIYNLIQVVFCSYMFVEASLGGWLTDYSWKCQPIDRSPSPKAMRMVNVVYLYHISKILDFTDTVFLVLAKRWNGVSLLHVLHHGIMYMGSWEGFYYSPGGHYTFVALLNSGVHVLMYSYYFLSACGKSVQPYLWWKRYLTTVQIVQFIAMFIHTTQVFFRDCPNVSKVYAVLICIYTLVFTALFTDYYVHEFRAQKYVQKKLVFDQTPVESKPSNGLSLRKWATKLFMTGTA